MAVSAYFVIYTIIGSKRILEPESDSVTFTLTYLVAEKIRRGPYYVFLVGLCGIQHSLNTYTSFLELESK